jgi:flagellar FliL protein
MGGRLPSNQRELAMPGDDDLTMKQGGDSGDKKEQTEESGKKGGLFSNKLVLFGGAGLATIIFGIALAMFVIKPMMSDVGDEEPEADQTEEMTSADDGGHDAEKESKPKKTRKPKKKRGKKSAHGKYESTVYSIRDIVINPAGTGGTRFLSVSIAFELETAELAHDFEAREPIVRDALITILSSKTVAQLTDPKQREITRYQIKKRISKIMRTDELAGVYYTDFVLQ